MLLLFSRSVVSDSASPCTAAQQASLSFTVSQSSLKLKAIESKIIYQKPSHICYFSENREGWGSGKETKSKIGRMKLNEIKIFSGIQLDITS